MTTASQVSSGESHTRGDDDQMQCVPLASLARMLPGKPSASTVRRWVTQGRTSQSGKLVRLETVRLTNGRGSSIERYKEFLQRLQD
ncbi:hypothetical protein U8335_23800 [Roseiconus lacunae]|uniref:hypothetical protein n=1 Tax=Roseiconus lacunae TaxID=2605694 RepID=UPI00309390BF|nr:hypothetical protein U8335_23800 [Stieleria sp. HD01]